VACVRGGEAYDRCEMTTRESAAMGWTWAMGMWTCLAVGGCGSERGGADAGGASEVEKEPDALGCEGLASAAQAQFSASLQGMDWQACQVDSDCTVLHVAGCWAVCGTAVATAAAGEVTAASVGVCDGFLAAHCQTVVLCLAMRAACDHGACVMAPLLPPDGGVPDAPAEDAGGGAEVAGADGPSAVDVARLDAGAAVDGAGCDQLAAAAQVQVEAQLRAGYSLACQVDADCAFLQPRSLSCFAACGNVVVRSADVTAATDATAGACGDYFSAGCPEKYPPCPYSRPVCVQGTCAKGGLPATTVDAN
jgi:hypothetical protein